MTRGEYIKKEDTIKCLNDLFGEMYHVSFGNVLQSLDSLQTYSFPDSAENKGEWIYQEGVTPYKWRCNKCERMFKTDFNYCPNCGADMRGET